MSGGEVSLRARLTSLCLAVSLLLLGMAVGATVLADRSHDRTDTLARTIKPARNAVEALRSGVIVQRSAMRGFAVTGSSRELAEYRDAGAEYDRLMAALRGQVDRQAAFVGRLAAVDAAYRTWRAEVAAPVVSATQRAGAAAGQRELQARVANQFTDLRNELDALLGALISETDRAVETVRRISDQLSLLLTAAAVCVLFSAALLLVFLQRWVIRPLTVLGEGVRAVAGGEFARHIAPAGPRELNRLAADVDSMRRRIVDDLAAVRAARQQVVEANARLEAQATELTRSNRDLEQFAYVASHDLQEPLRKVASFCQLLQRRYGGQLDEKADQYIAFAVDGAQRMQRLINDLLAFSRIGRRTSQFEALDLNAVLARVCTDLRAEAEAVGGEIRVGDLPAVRGEESLVTTVVTNLLANALKFRRPDVPPVVEVSARRAGRLWELTVRDNGIGIPAEYADKVFVIFQRLHGRESYAGTGIGLAIVKKIVEYHGGEVWLDTDGGPGTTIRLTLPDAGTAPPA
ncbi:histidine kinase [Pilimelia terevasa]|uniref:histidine kinase n=1 Tax=Pilimelia terevasa TaxID=53372 RepID=A0A8J3BD37_9ACTN|nr:ATP-binding protein [Pilimelia terevasa]GGK12811.1 histidine kinase [Pilimelia terevasa]